MFSTQACAVSPTALGEVEKKPLRDPKTGAMLQ
jgi:hypothetical protein